MNTEEIVYLVIFLSIIITVSVGGGWFIRTLWFKWITFVERTQKWKRNGGKW